MRKYLALFLVFYTLGIVASPFISSELTIYFSLAFIITSVIVVLIFKPKMYFPMCILSLAVGILFSTFTFVYNEAPYKEYYGKTKDITVQVVKPYEKEGGKYIYPVKYVENGKRKGGTILLSVDNSYSKVIYSYGQTLDIINAEITPYTDVKSKFYHLSNGEYASIFIEDFNISNSSKTLKISRIKSSIYAFRKIAARACDDHLPKDVSALVRAITLGDKGGLSDDVKDDFSNSGLSHILAISGLHLSLILGFLSAFFDGLKKKKYILFPIQIVFCLFMIILTGGQYSVIRASVMYIIMALSGMFYREYDSLTSLMASGGLIAFLNPYSVYNTGFLMSFFATLGIILFSKRISTFLEEKLWISNKFLNDSLSISMSAQIFIIPITALSFNSIQLISVFSNVLAAPVFSFLLAVAIVYIIIAVTVPLCLPIFSGVVYFSSRILMAIAHYTAKIPYASIDISQESFLIKFSIVASLCLAGWVFKITKSSAERIISLILSSVVLVTSLFMMTDKNYSRVSFIDVGQGDCALVETSGKTVLVDGGNSNEKYDVGRYKIKPYLVKRGISSIDYAIITHYHEDHFSGILYLMKNSKIKTLIVSGASNPDDESNKSLILKTAEEMKIPVYFFYEKDAVKLSDNAQFTVYSPLRDITYSSNDESLVVKFTTNGVSFLFTGDIEKSGESKIVDKDIRADVLKVPHHGSHSSGSSEFLESVKPKYAVISCGKNNIYKHPHDETLQSLEKAGAKILRTDTDGTIVFIVTKDGKLKAPER